MRAILFFVSVVVLIGIMHMLAQATRKASRKASRKATRKATRKASRKALQEPFDNTCGEIVECQDGKNKHVVTRRHDRKNITHTACCDPGSYINTPSATYSTCTTCPDADGVPSEHYDKLTDNSTGMINDDDSLTIMVRENTIRSCRTKCKVGTENEGVWDNNKQKYIMADGRKFMCKKYYSLTQATDAAGVPLTNLYTFTWDDPTAMEHEQCPSGQATHLLDGREEPEEGDFCCQNWTAYSNLRNDSDDTTRCCMNDQINLGGECISCPSIQKNDLLNTADTTIFPIGSREYDNSLHACTLSQDDIGACSQGQSSTLTTNDEFSAYDGGCTVGVYRATMFNDRYAVGFDPALHRVKYDDSNMNAYVDNTQDELNKTLFEEFSKDYLLFQPNGDSNNQVVSESTLARNAKRIYTPSGLSDATDTYSAVTGLTLSTDNIVNNLYACKNTDSSNARYLRRASDGGSTEYGCCLSGEYLSGSGASIKCAAPQPGHEILDANMVTTRMTSDCPVGFGLSNSDSIDACWPCADIDSDATFKQHGKWYSSNVATEACTDITDLTDPTKFSLNGESEDITIENIPEGTILGVNSDAVVVADNQSRVNSLKLMRNHEHILAPRTSSGELNGFGQHGSTVYLYTFDDLKLATVSGDSNTKYLVHVVNTSTTERQVLRFLKNSLTSTLQSIDRLYFSAGQDYTDSDGNEQRMVVTEFPKPQSTENTAHYFDIGTTGGSPSIYKTSNLTQDYREYLVTPTYSPNYIATCTPSTDLNRNRTAYTTPADNDGMCEDCDTGSNVGTAADNYQCTLETDCRTSAYNDVFAVQETDGTWRCISIGVDEAYDVNDPSTLIDCADQGKQRLVTGTGRITTDPLALQCDECPVGEVLDGALCEPCASNTRQVGNVCEPCPIWAFSTEGSTTCTPCDPLDYRTSSDATTCEGTLAYNEYFYKDGTGVRTCGAYARRNDDVAIALDPPYAWDNNGVICKTCDLDQYLDPSTENCENFAVPDDDGKKRDENSANGNGWSWCPVNQVRDPNTGNTCHAISDNNKYRTVDGMPTDLPLNMQRHSTDGASNCPLNHIRESSGSTCKQCYLAESKYTPFREEHDDDCRVVPDDHEFLGGQYGITACNSDEVASAPNYQGVVRCSTCPPGEFKDTNSGTCEPLLYLNYERKSCNGGTSGGSSVCESDLTKLRPANDNCCTADCRANTARPNKDSAECIELEEGESAHGVWCDTNKRRGPSGSCDPCPTSRPVRGREEKECRSLNEWEYKDDSNTDTGATNCPDHKIRRNTACTTGEKCCVDCGHTTPVRYSNEYACRSDSTVPEGKRLFNNQWTWCPSHQKRSPTDHTKCVSCGGGKYRLERSDSCESASGGTGLNCKYESGSDECTACPPHHEGDPTNPFACKECTKNQYTAEPRGNCMNMKTNEGRKQDQAGQDVHGFTSCDWTERDIRGYCPTCLVQTDLMVDNKDCKSYKDVSAELAEGFYINIGVKTIKSDELQNPQNHIGSLFTECGPHRKRASDNISPGCVQCEANYYRNQGKHTSCVYCNAGKHLITKAGTTEQECVTCTDNEYFDDTRCASLEREMGYRKTETGGRELGMVLGTDYKMTDRTSYLENKVHVNSDKTKDNSTGVGTFEPISDVTSAEQCAAICRYYNNISEVDTNSFFPSKSGVCTYFRYNSTIGCQISSAFDYNKKDSTTKNRDTTEAEKNYGYAMLTNVNVPNLGSVNGGKSGLNDFCFRDDMCTEDLGRLGSLTCDYDAAQRVDSENHAQVGICKKNLGDFCAKADDCESQSCSAWTCNIGDRSVAIGGDCYANSDCESDFCSSNTCAQKTIKWGNICDGTTPCVGGTACKAGNNTSVRQCLKPDDKVTNGYGYCYASSECAGRDCKEYWTDTIRMPNVGYRVTPYSQRVGFCK